MQEGENAEIAKKLHGQIAIASAKEAYQTYKRIFGREQFRKLDDKGFRPQRLLWASTSTKNPEYNDVKYIEALIGRDTVNTIPIDTLDLYRDHGKPEVRIEQEVMNAHWMLDRLPELGINIDNVTQQLEDEGIEKFNKSFDTLMQTLEKATGK